LPKPRIIVILSNKGGTGKSTFSVSLTQALKRRGKTVALLDLDFASPCAQLLTQTKSNLQVDKKGFTPATTEEGIELFSFGLLLSQDTPVMLRGIKRAEIVQQLAKDIRWNKPDYIVVDLPSGIQEESLSLLRNLKPNKTVIIIQPDKLSISSARRIIKALRHMKVNVSGIVENMGYIKCPKCGEETKLFADSAKQLSQETKVAFLGSIPFIPHPKTLPIDESVIRKVM